MDVRVGVVADDLTGACDTAVQFVKAGWDTELQLRAAASSSRVVAVTTDSRASDASAAATAVTDAVGHLRIAGITHLYKKIDSTLRGQICAEVRAAIEAWSADAIAVVCPAFPAAGRTLVDGHLRVDGVLVTGTAAATDPVTPVTESHLPTLLKGFHVAARVGESAEQLAGRLTGNGRVVVVDAANEGDLRRLANAIALLRPNVMAVGSAGLAKHLAEAWMTDPSAHPAIVLVTSMHDVARCQAVEAAAAFGHRREPTPDDLLDAGAWERWSAQVIEDLEHVGSALVLTPPADRSLPATLIPQRFAALAARIVTEGPRTRPSGIIVTGGDGARALVDALGATGIRLIGEVVAGVPIGTLVGGPAEGLAVVTKAGGFGEPDALVQAVHAVRRRSPL